MIDHLFPYYERELRYVNLLTQEFAPSHPNAAKRLGLEATGSSDPYVRAAARNFALLAGRTHAKIEDEYPELTDGLLQFLYPHFLAPIPSMAMVQFEPDPARVQTPHGFTDPGGQHDRRGDGAGGVQVSHRISSYAMADPPESGEFSRAAVSVGVSAARRDRRGRAHWNWNVSANCHFPN